MDASSLYQSYYAGSEALLESSQEHFHSSLKSTLSLEDRTYWFPCIILLCTRKHNLPLRFIFQKWKKIKNRKVTQDIQSSVKFVGDCSQHKQEGSDLYISQSGCDTQFVLQKTLCVLSINQSCPLWFCPYYNRKTLILLCFFTAVV